VTVLQNSGFFNSVNGDRRYKAEFFAEYFASFVGNGVFPNPSTGLQAMANNDMTVTVKAGKGWINGALYVNDNDLILPIDVADGVLNRIDRIVLRMDTVGRAINAVVKKGVFASSPVAPVLQRDADAYELGIADIYIAAGATQITQANITDLRLNTSLCGIVHGTVDQVDTTTLFNQYLSWLNQKKSQYDADMLNWTAQKQTDFNTWYNDITSASQTEIDNMEADFQQDWDSWFATVQSALDGDTAGNLLNLINQNTSSITNLANAVDKNKTDLVSQDVNKGASLIGIHDANSQFASANVEGALNELAARPQKDMDNGRYQAEFGLEDAVLNNLISEAQTCLLGYTNGSTATPQAPTSQTSVQLDAMGLKIHVVNAIPAIKVVMGSNNSNITRLQVLNSSKTSVYSMDVTGLTTATIPYSFNANTDYYIVLDNTGSSFLISYVTSGVSFPYNSTDINITGGVMGTNDQTSYVYGFTSIIALKNALTGTAIKTHAPTDIAKWGNVKVKAANLGANNSATVTVKSSSNVQLKAPVTLVNGDNYIDISNINPSTYASLKGVITLSRNSTGDASPTISNFSVTREGSIGIVNKGIIMQYTATDDLTKEVVFSGLNLKGYTKIELYIFARTTDANNDGGMSFKLNNGSAINLGLLLRGNQDNGWAVCSILDNIYNAMCMVNSSNQEIHGGMSNILLKDLISISVLNSSSTYFFKTGSKFILMGVS